MYFVLWQRSLNISVLVGNVPDYCLILKLLWQNTAYSWQNNCPKCSLRSPHGRHFIDTTKWRPMLTKSILVSFYSWFQNRSKADYILVKEIYSAS